MDIYLPIAEVSVNWPLLVLLGATVGFVSGLVGIGGGFLRWGRFVAVAAMLGVLAAMALTPDLAPQFWASMGFLCLVLIAAAATRKRR